MRVAVGADHGGYRLKDVLADLVRSLGHDVHDLGTHSDAPVDYPDFARSVAGEIRAGRAERGMLVCGSGVGVCIAANKFPGIRAALNHDTFSARQGVEDDGANVLCLGARVVGSELAKDIVRVWLA